MTRKLHPEALPIVAMALVFLGAGLFSANEGFIYLVALIMIWSIFALGYDIAFGLSGLLSFGHAAFFGLGAYAAAWAMLDGGWPFSLALLAAAGAGALTALLFGIIGRRVSGLYFSLMTLMLAELIAIVMTTRLRKLSGGVDGLPGVPRPVFGEVDFFSNHAFYWSIYAAFVATLIFCGIFKHSPFGQALQGLRQNPVRAEQIGFDIGGLRLAALTVSGGFSGLAGAYLASLMMYVGPQMLNWKISGDVVIMTLLGGSGTLLGPVIGVTLVELLREGLSASTQYWYGILGVIFIFCTIFLPQGLVGLGARLWRRP